MRCNRLVLAVCWTLSGLMHAQSDRPQWTYAPELLRPVWQGDTVVGESVLFIRNEGDEVAKARVLFPIESIVGVQNSAGDITFEEGRDYRWQAGSSEIIVPTGSRIPTRSLQDLRRPANSQKYQLTHRDGNGEIYFGAKLEYAEMQTCITYRHAPDAWQGDSPKFHPQGLPKSTYRLLNKQLLKIALLGDSISAGANASALAESPPFQPAYPELLRAHLEAWFQGKVELTNFAVGGTDTAWGLSQIDKLIEVHPDLVIWAFGMNDSAGRDPAEYQQNTRKMIAGIREKLPDCEFLLVASMLGNRGWTRLQHEYFPQYRDKLLELREVGIAVADVTAIWTRFLEHKQDWDQSGNGVNHPNDFGHRVYAQVLAASLMPDGNPDTNQEPAQPVESGGLRLRESRILGNYTYSYACLAIDLDGDGDLDLTSSDAEPNSNLYLLSNDGRGAFEFSFIQKFAGHGDQPVRLERHAAGDINGDGRPDIVIVDNLNWDVRWFENPGPERLRERWPLHRICAPRELPGSYDVALGDLDGDGDQDVATSSWRFGNRFDWYENLGQPGSGSDWLRHEIDSEIGETRTIAIADFNRDGKPDLLGTSRTGNRVLWYANSGAPASEGWNKQVIDASTIAPTHGHPVDLDGDGDIDVVMAFGLAASANIEASASHQVAWYENLGSPGTGKEWRKHSIAANFPQAFEAVTGDLDGDGDLDVVATAWTSSGGLYWMENPGDPRGEWQVHRIKVPWSNAVTVVLADMDGDQRLDIVACAERGANELRWWRNEPVTK